VHRLGISVILALCVSTPLLAHHEAIFGPQSAMVLTAETYLTAQMFTRKTGLEGQRVQETTTVLSTGFSPFKRPVSVALIVPFSFLSSAGSTRVGLEDAILGVRYRADLPAVTRALSAKESFVMGVGGVELPTGTLDHRFGRDAVGGIAAMLGSVEVGEFSVIGYGFYRRQGTYDRARESANLFVGAGGAWTPIDDPSGRILSLQLGVSRESMSREEEDGAALHASGGSGVFAHPTVLWGPAQKLLFFVQGTIPVQQNWRDASQQERFRMGAGIILAVGR
jgi:hypothetical protein